MKRIYILFAVFSILLNSCSSEDNDSLGEFIIKGHIVTEPTNTPLSGVQIRVTNNNYTLATATSDIDGSFTLSVDRSQLDNSYFLSIFDPKMEIVKQIAITGIGLSEYDFGNIVLYDSRNPYNLPSFEYNGYAYVVHPVLRRKYALNELDSACDGLNDYGITNWFLPNEMEFRKIISMVIANKIYDLVPGGLYWTSDFDGKYTTLMNYDGYTGVSKNGSSNPNQMGYIIPIYRYK